MEKLKDMEPIISLVGSVVIPIVSLAIPMIIKMFMSVSKITGLEDYQLRVKAKRVESLSIVGLFILTILLMGTYRYWMPEGLDGNKGNNIIIVATLYIFLSFIIFIMAIARLVYECFRNRNSKDEYKKKFEVYKIRNLLYFSIGIFLTGYAIALNNIQISIMFSLIISITGFVLLVGNDYVVNKAILYYEDLEKIYIYRAIDENSFLCGIEKNALACKYYIVKSKEYVLGKKLYVVDRDIDKKNTDEESVKKSFSNYGGMIFKCKEAYRFTIAISTIIVSSIIISIILCIVSKQERIIDIFVIMLIAIFSICIINCWKNIVSIIRGLIEGIKRWLKLGISIVATILYIVFLSFRLRTNVGILELMTYFLVLYIDLSFAICLYIKIKNK